MCGIGGYFLREGRQLPATILDAMHAAIAHRGPDAEGRFLDENAGLVHARLSIVDPQGGDQPFICRQGTGERRVLVANGEIYNHETLRRTHCSDYDFTSDSDCEVIPELVARLGHEAVRELRGMYAFALYHPESGSAMLARDPFGIKPLYYHESEIGIIFASEPSAIRAAGLASETGNAGDGSVGRALHAACIIDRQYAPDEIPAFADIRRVAPGETLLIEKGRIVARSLDRPLDDVLASTSPSGIEGFDAALHESIEAHLMADVPVGLFFSGGVDSSSLLCGMAKIRRRANAGPVLAYHVRFEGADTLPGTEASLASETAKSCGAEFIDVPYTKADFLAGAGSTALCVDDAIADYAALPTIRLAQRAARDVKVVLSGEGGDEFLAGYSRYRAGLRVVGAKFPTRPGPALVAGLLREDIASILEQRMAELSRPMPGVAMRIAARGRALDQLQRHDIEEWLPNNLLVKLDRCLMRHGVEGRTPFVDRAFSCYGLGLGTRQRIRGRTGKWLMKSWLRRHLPAARPFARKRGFTVPVGAWIAEESSRLAPLVAAQPGTREVVNQDMVAALFDAADGRAGLLAWRTLFYALWHQIHHVGIDAHQPIEDILAAR